MRHHLFRSVALWSERLHHSQCLSEAAMKNHISLCLYQETRPPPLRPDTIGLARQLPLTSLSGPEAPPRHHHHHQQHIWLVYHSHSGTALLPCPTLGYLGSKLVSCRSQPRGQPFPQLWARRLGTHGNTKGGEYQEGINEGEGNYALTSCPLSLLGLSHLLCPKSTLGITWLPLYHQHMVGREVAGSYGREQCSTACSNQSKFLPHCSLRFKKSSTARWPLPQSGHKQWGNVNEQWGFRGDRHSSASTPFLILLPP